MQANSSVHRPFTFAPELVREHFGKRLPVNFMAQVGKVLGTISNSQDSTNITEGPILYSAPLPGILDWLHGQENPQILEEKPCMTPLLLYDITPSTERLLFHYEGNPESASLIRHFIELFSLNIQTSQAVIISPRFIPKSKVKEEQELIQLVRESTADTSFIKFNFNKMGDFWSYAVKHQSTLLVTTKNYQAELAKLLFHFYKGGMWYDKLSLYLGKS